MLTKRQLARYAAHGPRHVSLTEASRASESGAVIAEGVPGHRSSITILQAGVIMVGKVVVPVTHEWQYELYELTGVGARAASGVHVAVWHKQAQLEPIPMRFGGVLGEQRVKASSGEAKQRMLVAAYHTPLDASS
jgi:hypothetical protein